MLSATRIIDKVKEREAKCKKHHLECQDVGVNKIRELLPRMAERGSIRSAKSGQSVAYWRDK